MALTPAKKEKKYYFGALFFFLCVLNVGFFLFTNDPERAEFVIVGKWPVFIVMFLFCAVWAAAIYFLVLWITDISRRRKHMPALDPRMKIIANVILAVLLVISFFIALAFAAITGLS